MKKGLKITLFSLAGLLAAFLLYEVGVGGIFYATNKTHYKKVEAIKTDIEIIRKNDVTTLVSDDTLKILQLSDTHIGAGFMSGDNDHFAFKAIDELIKESSPDLVVITGDLVYPSKLQSFNSDNLKAIKMLASVMEAYEIPWAPVFGNHDAQAGAEHSREELGTYLESLDYCLFEKGPTDIDGVGNYVINVENTNGKIIQSLYFMDSNDYVSIKGDEVSAFDTEYDHIHENQIKWYESQISKMNKINNYNGYNNVNSLLFMHIPLEEYNDALENGEYVLGNKGELIWNGPNYGMFDKMVELNSTKGAFCGHDHLNNHSYEYKGIKLTYGMSIDYIAYGKTKFLSKQRGGTVIEVNQDGSFDIKLLPYNSL